MMLNKWLFTVLIISGSNLAWSQQAEVTLQSTVKGNQEQPKVLYIMPWQKADRVKLNYAPMQGIAGEVFSAIDRDEFLREVKYKQQLSAKAQAVKL